MSNKKGLKLVILIRGNIKTRDPILPNAKTRDRVPAYPGQSHPIPGFSSPLRVIWSD